MWQKSWVSWSIKPDVSLSSSRDNDWLAHPGFIATRPKCTVPSSSRSRHGLSKSPTPILVPPVVMITSASSRPRFIAAVVADIVSSTIPRSRTSYPSCWRIEMSDGRFVSMMELKLDAELAGVRVSCRLTSSLPVERTATVGRRKTLTCEINVSVYHFE